MRVTQSMLNNNFMRNLSSTYERMAKYQEQLYTGKKVSRPSDDPVVAMKGMNYRTELTEIKQFQRNLGEVYSWMDDSDDALEKATSALHRIRDIAIQASNDTYEEGRRGNMAQEIEQLGEHLLEISNTKVNNKYIFNGTDTTNPRFNADGTLANAEYDEDTGELVSSGNTEAVKIPVSDGVTIQANINPDNVFSKEVFDKIQEFADALNAGETGETLDDFVDDFDAHINSVVDERAKLGARMNRIEMVEDRLSSQEIVATKVMSSNEDVDFERVIMDLKTEESLLRASLSTGASIIQPTLMDFLR